MPVRDWTFPLALDPQSEEPLFLQIARAVVNDIRRGRLRPGARLPGTRTLAQTLSVHRNTIVAAYSELLAEGWLLGAPARGTYVSAALPELPPRRFSATVGPRPQVPSRLGFDLAPGPPPGDLATAPPGALLMGGGLPDVRLAPTTALSRAYRRALRAPGRSVLSYADPHGHPRLRAALAGMLASTRGLASAPDDLLITRGSQQALDLVSRALLMRGDAVAVEALGYPPAWETFRQRGARLFPIPLDGEGMRIDALETLCRRRQVRAVYLTPHHQYPTQVTLTAGRRLALLALCRRLRLAVIEDDYDHEFHYEGRPVLPLASADHAGVVVYIGTLAKILAPGLRLGYVVAPPPLRSCLAAHRLYMDRQGDHAVECAVAELIEDGELQRHARRARRVYQARRDHLVTALHAALGGVLRFAVPCGGLALWAQTAPELDVEAWAAAALRRGVQFHPGRRFAFDGKPRAQARLGFAALREPELTEAVQRLKRAFDDVRA